VGFYKHILLKLPQPAQQIRNKIWTRPRKFM
jgi:hypothetical protein